MVSPSACCLSAARGEHTHMKDDDRIVPSPHLSSTLNRKTSYVVVALNYRFFGCLLLPLFIKLLLNRDIIKIIKKLKFRKNTFYE